MGGVRLDPVGFLEGENGRQDTRREGFVALDRSQEPFSGRKFGMGETFHPGQVISLDMIPISDTTVPVRILDERSGSETD